MPKEGRQGKKARKETRREDGTEQQAVLGVRAEPEERGGGAEHAQGHVGTERKEETALKTNVST